MKQLSAAFVKAKRSFGPALKDKSNPHFKSKYADLGACLDAVEGALLDNGIAVLQDTFEDPTGVTVETVLLHESGEERRCGKLHVPAAKQDPQGYGSALTYARRYSLMTACGIAPEDDDGEAASSRVRAQQRSKWLSDQFASIDAAPNSVALKKVVADALAIAANEQDMDAIDQIKAHAAAKVAAEKSKNREEATA